MNRTGIFLLLGTTAFCPLLPGQGRLRLVAPQAGALATPQEETGGIGVNVEMFENPNLDRFLDKAQRFLSRQDWGGAISVIQDVVEGRTSELVRGKKPAEGKGDKGDGKTDPKRSPNTNPKKTTGLPPADELNVREAVHSADGRLYRPVRRLCMKLLASMPVAGVELYRQRFEVLSGDLLAEALAERSLSKLQRVYESYFVTRSAGQAMWAAGDMLMDQGRFRGAIQTYRDLLEVYPENSRRVLGIEEIWLRFKVALCLRMLGEKGKAIEELQSLAADHSEDSLRIMGELEPLESMHESEVFESGTIGRTAVAVAASDEHLLFQSEGETLVPLWEHRFEDPAPYRGAKNSNRRGGGFVNNRGGVRTVAPTHTQFKPGTWLSFDGEKILLMDHYRLGLRQGLSGLILKRGDGNFLPETPRASRARSRIPVLDASTLKVVADEERYYTIIGPESKSRNVGLITNNRLIAYDRTTLQRVWSTEDWQDGNKGLRKVTLLAAPIIFGEVLLLPVLDRGAYGLQCVDRHTGEPRWRTKVHANGSRFVRAPGSSVRVEGGLAYVLTNAGCIGAIDAYTGEVRWIRRYERSHPQRQAVTRRIQRSSRRGRRGSWGDDKVSCFLNQEPIIVDGMIIFAPCDGDVIHCLDGATGDPVWMLSGSSRHAEYNKILHMMGHDGENLFLLTSREILCVGLRSGVRKWMKSLPPVAGARSWRGRGLVTDRYVAMPGNREVHLLPTDGSGNWRSFPLPQFSVSKDPLSGPANLFAHGPFLGVAYEGGIEIFSSDLALETLASRAESSLEKADYLVQAGKLRVSMDLISDWLAGEGTGAEKRARHAAFQRLLSIARDLARQHSSSGQAEAALAVLEKCAAFAASSDQKMQWRLARLELFRELDDLRSYGQEQQALYKIMEGRD